MPPKRKSPEHAIVETSNFRDLLKYIKADTTAVALDLDNTVCEAQTALGSDQWFEQLYKESLKLFPPNGQHQAVPVYHAVQKFVKLSPVEPISVYLIKALQDTGIPVLAITARGDCLEATTVRQLKDIGIDFSRSNLQLGIKPTELKIQKHNGQSVHYANGIIYCSGNDKGQCLDSFIDLFENKQYELLREKSKHLKLKPHNETRNIINHFVMADDKDKYLHQVKNTCEKYGAHFHGLWYRRLDAKVKSLDYKMAQEQLAHIDHLIPKDLHPTLQKFGVKPVSDEEKYHHQHFYQEEAKPTSPENHMSFFAAKPKPRQRMLSENDKNTFSLT